MIPQTVIEEILNKISITDIIGRYTEIKKTGKNALALCPFHQEKTPSFSISDEKGLYHCFGCGASGNTIKFLMDYQKLTFIEALQELAKSAGIDINQYSANEDFQPLKEKETLNKINKEAMVYYHRLLWSSRDAQEARNYLKNRKIDPEMVKLYRIGYGGKKCCLRDYLVEKGFKEADIIKSGLVSGENNWFFERFKERIIFPILDRDGNVVGFGGRILPGDKKSAKYLNSAENSVFHKGSLLFSFNLAKDEILKEKEAILVEGYMDVISLYQNGIKNSVAPLGTSLTDNQLNILKKYCDRILLIFDGDQAGIKAANRALDISVASGLDQWVVILPDNKDPYDYSMEYGKDGLIKYIEENKKNPIDFKLWFFSREINVSHEKLKFLVLVFTYISKVRSSIKRDEYLKRTADFINVDIRLILTEYGNYINNNKNMGKLINPVNGFENYNRIESIFISLLIMFPESVTDIEAIVNNEMIVDNEIRDIYSYIKNYRSKNTKEIVSALKNDYILSCVAEYAQQDIKKDHLFESAYQIKFLYIKRKMSEYTAFIKKLESEGAFKKAIELSGEKQNLVKEASEIEKMLKNYELIE